MLKTLDLSNNIILHYPECISNNHTLKELILTNNAINKINSFNNSLECLQLNNNKLSELPSDINNNHTLKILDLSVNEFNNIDNFYDSLKNNDTLERLYLANCKIENIISLSEMLLTNKALKYLNLINNDFYNNEQISKLFKSLEINTTLTDLYIIDKEHSFKNLTNKVNQFYDKIIQLQKINKNIHIYY